MFDFKTVALSAFVAFAVSMGVLLVGGGAPAVGGETRFPNSSLTAQGLSLEKSGTTTLSTGKVCMEVTQVDGDVTYAFFNNLGTLATSSVSCL